MKIECTGKDHPIWYPWFWSQEHQRWERECAMMGCEAWQFAPDARPEGRRIVKRPGTIHEHGWTVWQPVDEFHVEDNLFYRRDCRCGAVEFVENLVVLGNVEFFSRTR